MEAARSAEQCQQTQKSNKRALKEQNSCIVGPMGTGMIVAARATPAPAECSRSHHQHNVSRRRFAGDGRHSASAAVWL